MVVLTFLVELHDLPRKSTFLHNQKTVSFLIQFAHLYALVIVLKFSSQVRRKTLEEPVLVHGSDGAAGALADSWDVNHLPRDP